MRELARLELEPREGGVVARLSGELDLSNASDIGTQLQAAAAEADLIVADLGAVTYFDSSGVRMLDELCATGRLRVVAPEGSRARIVLRICAFPPELLFESPADALA